MKQGLGLSNSWQGKMYQSFSNIIDWKTVIDSNLEKYGEGDGIRVLIIGSGIDSHMDLNKAGGYNLSTANPYSSNDTNGHSTFVAGIIAGNGNHYIKGIAPKAEVASVKVVDKDEIVDYRTLETALLWAKDNFSSVVLVDLELYGTLPFTVKKSIELLEKDKIPVFINGLKNKKYDFTAYEVETLKESCWLDNWYKSVEDINYSIPIAVGLAALIKSKYSDITTDEIYNSIYNILFNRTKKAKK